MTNAQYSLWSKRERRAFMHLESLHDSEDEALMAADALLLDLENEDDDAPLLSVMLKRPDGTTLNTWNLVS